MKKIVSLILVLVNLFLVYLLIMNIKEPIAFQDIKNERKETVVTKLQEIRKAQEVYRAVTGEFAHNFDTLAQVIKTDSIKVITVYGDKDDVNSTEEIKEIISYVSAYDSLMAQKKINLDSLRFVPYSDGKTFAISADTMTYQSTLVNVVEVGTSWSTFMGKYASPQYAKYDNSYDPAKKLKFGSMDGPNLAGNWER